ncbi:MAG: hypothetical protein KatS3mg095_0561 [Candidatus Parcubacteria bacterium]|nr:MAG: hypothetical protein KatS3mg095_0561 [Candidatus Parcubacteria bacterium]
MSLESFSEKFKRIVDSEGAIRIFKTENKEEAEKYINEAIEYYKKTFSKDVKNMTFHYFLVKQQGFVLIIDNQGRTYKYNCQEKNIVFD